MTHHMYICKAGWLQGFELLVHGDILVLHVDGRGCRAHRHGQHAQGQVRIPLYKLWIY